MSSDRPPAASVSGSSTWDQHADWWKESFTAGADVEYEDEILPLVRRELAGAGRVLDIGCGEGQVSRALKDVVGTVVGIDPSERQLTNARALDTDVALVKGAGEALAFCDGSFDAALCCLSIEHADDIDAVLAEVARVLADGGVFLLLINHPLYQGPDSGLVDDHILGERYWRVGRYLHETTVLEHVDAHVRLPFAHRPLSRYINPLAAADLVLVRMLEPPPLPGFLEHSVDPDLEGAIPRLLALRFEHRPRASARWPSRQVVEAPAGTTR